jgi:hypothetical protein
MSKYNLGCGPRKIKDFIGVDAREWDGNTDVIWDLTKIPYNFITDRVDELIAIEVLEHLALRDLEKTVSEWYRVLSVGGKLTVQVPDCGKMMEAYVNKQVCDCVPHKATSLEGYKADQWCVKCGGKAIVNPIRWLFAFTGAQKHEYDFHRSIFTKESLKELLNNCGFENVEFLDHPFKLIAVCHK